MQLTIGSTPDQHCPSAKIAYLCDHRVMDVLAIIACR